MTLKDPYISQRCREIEGLLTDAAGWASSDEKLGAHLAAYLSVLITGMVEDCIEYLVSQRVGKTQDREVQDFVSETLRQRFRNPDRGRISDLLKQFSTSYQQRFAKRIPHDGSAATALRSIVENKNSLSHTGTWKLQMTVADADNYYHRILPILEALEDVLS